MSDSWARMVCACALLAAAACTPRDDAARVEPRPSTAQPDFTRYTVTLGTRRAAVVEVDLADRSFCSQGHVRWAKAGHLHQRAEGPAGDPVVLELFEPPRANRQTACVREVAPAILLRIVTEPQSYYLDFHEQQRGGREVRGGLGAEVKGLEVDVPNRLSVRAGEIFDFPVAARDGEGRITGLLVRFGDGATWGTLPFDLVCTATAGERDPAKGPSSRVETIRHAYRRGGEYRAVVAVTSGGCFTDAEESRNETTITVEGAARTSNGPFEPKAKIGHAYSRHGKDSPLFSRIGGYDADGYVHWVRVDWGDGTRREVMRRGLRKCHAGRSWPEGWFSDEMRHRYRRPGEYEVVVKVRSTGCDGRNAQADTTRRVLGYPPVQGG